jgi:nucleoside-diphosphate-sugar epimerase
MKIGVSGASGHLGRAVVSELLQRADGHEVVEGLLLALCRSQEDEGR